MLVLENAHTHIYIYITNAMRPKLPNTRGRGDIKPQWQNKQRINFPAKR